MTSKSDPIKLEYPGIEVSIAGWFLIAATLWELVFNRLFSALGIYSVAGADSRIAGLAESGLFAVNAVGIMGILLACILLPRLAADTRLAPLPARILLLLTSPLFLPIACVAVFRPVSIHLVLVSYLVTVSTVLYLCVLVAVHRCDGRSRRILLTLAFIQVITAFDLVVSGMFELVSQTTHLAAEVLFVLVPVFAFLFFIQGRLTRLLKQPPIAALAFALLITASAYAFAMLASDKTQLTLILLAFRSLGLTMSIPGGAALYLVALFFGSFLVGCLIFPSKAVPPTANSRKRGFGLALIFMAGIQPTHPYLSILMLVGFLYLSQHMIENLSGEKVSPPVPPKVDETIKKNIQSEMSQTSSLTREN
jgi:hypothetical protein